MRSFIASLVVGLTLALLPAVALMATVNVPNACGANDGLVHLDYAYDDQSLLIQSFTLVNDSPTPGTVILDVFTSSGQFVLERKLNIADGRSRTFDLTPFNLHMVMTTGARGTALNLPGIIACGWASSR